MNSRKNKTELFSTEVIGSLFGAILCILFLVLARSLFTTEFTYFFNWWLAVLFLGVVFMPASCLIFGRFSDLGWMFSKILGLAVSGWLMWYLSSLHIFKFTRANCIIVILLCLAGEIGIIWLCSRKKRPQFSFSAYNLEHILFGEALFLGVFVLWCYLKAFNPQAYGTTEKLMDFGFMEAMFKSDYMPPEDLWLAGESLNYYYVGQFMATYLTKVSNVGVEYGYNFMLMMVAAMGFSLPASIIFNVSKDAVTGMGRKDSFSGILFPYISAGLSGIAVSFSGNMHYVLYAKFIPWCRTMLGLDKLADAAGYTFSGYWFPDATRYIGYNPETNDKTIHEFPLYSFVLGDLHAHVINIIFVLTVVAILYAYLQFRKSSMDLARTEGRYPDSRSKAGTVFGIPDFYREVFNPCIVLTGFLIGLFHTTNYWDYPIYFVVAGAIILFSNATVYNFSKRTLILTAFHAAVVIVTAKLVCLPFTVNFHQISTSIRLCENHTPLYQLAVLWGLPLTVTFVFLGVLIADHVARAKSPDGLPSKTGGQLGLFRFIANLEISDLFVITLGLCAFGLVLIPEVIYVKDIYSGDYKRANTMFKLTYQSFIMFGMTMGYVIPKLMIFAKKARRRNFAIVTCVLLLLTTGYFGNSTKAWFGDYTDGERYQGLNAGQYLYGCDEQDYYATEWINENIEGRPVMLEVNGDSYTDYCRVSVRTGLPTLLGWKTHEWLWQSDETGAIPDIVVTREADIQTIYTSTDSSEVAALVRQYDIDYIYVGNLEKNKYSEPVNHQLLQSLGEVVYPADFDAADSASTTYIIKINK